MIAVVTAVNVWGTRKSSDLQNWTTLIKASLVVVLSAVLLALGHHGARTSRRAWAPRKEAPRCFRAFGLAMIAVLWAYEGWQFGTYSAGEVIDPQKSFPRAFLLGSLILVALYLIANVAYLIALGPDCRHRKRRHRRHRRVQRPRPVGRQIHRAHHPHLRL